MKVRDNSGGKGPKTIHTTVKEGRLASKSSNVIQLRGRQSKISTSGSESTAIQQAIKYSESLGW
jgi:hypothetical protein